VSSDSSARPAAVLWDFDGTILDTEPLWMASEVEFVASQGAIWTLDDAHGHIGASWRTLGGALSERITEQLGVCTFTPWQIYEELAARVAAGILAGRAPRRPGAVELLDSLNAAGWPCALVSASPAHLLDAGVASLGGNNRFATMVPGPMVEHGKPAPDCYLLAAEKLGVDVRDCIVLEDSPTGCEAGHRAGALVIGVPSVAPLPDVRGQVRRDSLVGLTPESMIELMRGHRHDAQNEPGAQL